MTHTQITKEQRFKIQSWREVGMSQTEMAERLGKNRSSIGRETKRNSDTHGYHGSHAHVLCRQRRKAGRRMMKKLVKNVRLRRAVLRRLRQVNHHRQSRWLSGVIRDRVSVGLYPLCLGTQHRREFPFRSFLCQRHSIRVTRYPPDRR